MLLIVTNSFAQLYEWSKEDRNNLYSECYNSISKFNITSEQKESLSLCYLEEITKSFTKREYQSKIEIEIKKN